ncbi:MAG: SDR family NAD(P)-dependent oxidoreductase [Granulosicoccus sp.]
MFIVTGASSGIGKATVLALAQRNHKVIAIGRNSDRLRLLEEVNPDLIQSVEADLATDSGIQSITKIAQSLSKIDGIIHAAGSAVPIADYQDLKSEELRRHFSVHVTAPIELNNRLRTKLKGARILYLDSYSARSPRIGWAAYSIVKSAAQMAARSAIAEMTDSTVIRVFPGGVRTPLVEAVLNSTVANQTVDDFRNTDSEGKIAEADVVGEYLADILLEATEQEIKLRETWDFNNAADRIFPDRKTTLPEAR